jgi:hypothetical protein
MQIKHLILEEACRTSKRLLYVSSWTKKIIIQKHICIHLSQINILLRKLGIAEVAFLEKKLNIY